ncbi:ML domain-containing protein [Mycena capillaripes]|nr:ML domain-containing protein [Mycena capillaripes]KAJ6533218.1 ML domain-containing protein [Mycena capillaripes]
MRTFFITSLLLAALVGADKGAQERFSLPSSTGGPSTAAAEWRYTDCGLSTDAIQLQDLALSPDPPVPGKNLTITATGVAQQTIEEGAYADVTVKLGLIKLLTKRFDLCEEARNANVSVTCPIQAGVYTVTHTVELPKEIPPAKFLVQVRAYTAEEDDMLCLDLFADFLPRI